MLTRGMAAHDESPPKPRQLTRCRPHLLDNVVDGDTGTKVIAWNGDADAMGIQPSGEVAERGTAQGLPVAAMNENNDRTLVITGKKINRVAFAGTVSNRPRSVPRAIGCGVSRPAGHDRRVLRNSRPVVVFAFVIDCRVQDATTPVASRISARRLLSLPADASIRGHPSG